MTDYPYLIPDGYEIDATTHLLSSIDRTVVANYDHEYVEKYEQLPQAELSAVRAGIIDRLIGQSLCRSICDVGYATGAFLKEIHQRYPTCEIRGYDVSPYPTPEFITIDPEWATRPVDVMTFFDSLEHFPTLDFLRGLKAQYVVVSCPWYHPALGLNHFTNWRHRKPGEHLHHFTAKSLQATMNAAGYRSFFSGSPEDIIRKSPESDNILTMVFKCFKCLDY